MMKAPFGFPLDPAVWTVEVTDTTERSQTLPVQNTWYNLGSVSIDIPIGIWHVSYTIQFENSLSGKALAVTLSDANNTELSPDNSIEVVTRINEETFYGYKEMNIVTTSKTTYYINTRSRSASPGTLYNNNDFTKLIIKVVSIYL